MQQIIHIEDSEFLLSAKESAGKQICFLDHRDESGAWSTTMPLPSVQAKILESYGCEIKNMPVRVKLSMIIEPITPDTPQ